MRCGEANVFDIARRAEIILANACHLTPHFCSLHHSQAFILKYIDVRCQHFDSEV